MRMVDIIDTKRNGGELTPAQIQFFIAGVVDGSIPDYQTTALLMAVYFKGMTPEERALLTMAMLHSGQRLDLTSIPGVKVDKHSTGGVGDKVSLPLAALVAAIGIPVPMVSGRGLGHTGGTLDKLEAIPGFQVNLDEQQFVSQVAKVGLAIISASDQIAPADKKIYALRDVTDTVDVLPLIASSIMSKKIASGTDALVIDVKTGAGAFMKTRPEARALAQALVNIGKKAGLDCLAVISDMNQPLGYKIGNSLEIEESIDLLKGKGPADLLDLVLTLGSYMAVLGKKAADIKAGRQLLQEALDSGAGLAKFKALVAAQGGDVGVIEDYGLLPQASYHIQLPAKQSGIVTQLAADKIGIASMMLGGGRQNAADQLDYAVGIELHKKIGDPVQKGEALLTIYSDQPAVPAIEKLLYQHIEIGNSVVPAPLILEVIS